MPQITELMKSVNRYIRFEISTRMGPLTMFGGGGAVTESPEDDEGFKEITEEDIRSLTSALSGG